MSLVHLECFSLIFNTFFKTLKLAWASCGAGTKSVLCWCCLLSYSGDSGVWTNKILEILKHIGMHA